MRKTPNVWYRNSVYMMDDKEMIYLQKRDCASCAVWEWIKSDCWKRTRPDLRELSEIEKEGVAESLGMVTEEGIGDSARFDKIVELICTKVNWIDENRCIKGWEKWQSVNTKVEDAARKRVEYWEKRTEEYETPELPPPLDTDEFKMAWEEYEKYRRQCGYKKLKPMSVSKLWSEMVGWGGEAAGIAAIQQTIAKGWQGVFPLKQAGQSSGAAPRETSYAGKLWALEQHRKTLLEQLNHLKEWGGEAKKGERIELATKIKEINNSIRDLKPDV